MYYHSSCNLRFVSSCKANASHGAVRGRGDVAVQFASDATIVSVFLWICGGCFYYCSSSNLRFASNCKVSIVGTIWTAEKAEC